MTFPVELEDGLDNWLFEDDTEIWWSGFEAVVISDTLGLTDIITKVGTFLRILTDTLGLTDIISTIGNIKKALIDYYRRRRI